MQIQSVVGLLGLAVGMHAAWNLLARQVAAPCNYLWWGLLAHLVLLSPITIYGLNQIQWSMHLASLNLLAALALSIYFVALRHAYRLAPATFVYPLARSSPLLIAVWTWLLWGTVPNALAAWGIGLSIAGLCLLALTGSAQPHTVKALPWVALAALCTSIYSICDKFAVQKLVTFPATLAYVSLSYFMAFLVMSALNWQETRQWQPACRPHPILVLLGGLCIGTSYALVIQVMQLLDTATAVTFSNAGIVLVSMISIFVLKEREQWLKRLTAASLISTGLIVLGASL